MKPEFLPEESWFILILVTKHRMVVISSSNQLVSRYIKPASKYGENVLPFRRSLSFCYVHRVVHTFSRQSPDQALNTILPTQYQPYVYAGSQLHIIMNNRNKNQKSNFTKPNFLRLEYRKSPMLSPCRL